MCGDHGQDEADPRLPWPDEVGEPPQDEPPGWTRRRVLGAGALAALGAVLPWHPGRSEAAATFAGAAPFVAGLHVHACYSVSDDHPARRGSR